MRQAQQAGEPYRLVLTDAHMPHIDGFMLAEQIKQDPAMGSTVVMMLTSGDRPEDMAQCDQLGIAAYLLKPVKQSELLEAIELALGITLPKEEMLGVAAAAAAACPQPAHPAGRGQPRQSETGGRACCEGQGHTVTVANNGKEAVAAAATQKFDLVLMDVQMPEMDGLEAAGADPAREQPTGTPPADHRHDRPRPEGRPRALPGGRHGQLRRQTDPCRGTLPGDRRALRQRASAIRPPPRFAQVSSTGRRP